MDGILLALMPLLGFVAGTIGALIGAGGGFIAVPILLIVLPNETPGIITGMSQSMVLMTSLSSTVAYVRQKRIEYRWAGRDGRNGPVWNGPRRVRRRAPASRRIRDHFRHRRPGLMVYLMIRPIRGRGAARTLAEAEEARVP